jgi:flagellar hook-associated protein 3 FlgL
MRITQGMLSQQMIMDLQGNYERLSQLQNEIATGKRINTPADDPIGVGFVMRYKNEVAMYNQYTDNANTAKSYLDNLDSTMGEAVQTMQEARNLAVQGASDTLTQSDRQKIAAEVDQLYQHLVTIGNAQYQGKYIFNGQMTATMPYDPVTAEASTTDDGQILYDISEGVHFPVNVSGNQFFGAPDISGTASQYPITDASDNAFSLLKQLKTALAQGTGTDVGNLLSKFDSRIGTMLDMRADVGARTDRVKLTQSRLDDLTQNANTLLSNTQDADMTKLIVDLKTAENVHQASLQVGARVILPTLVDFLK